MQEGKETKKCSCCGHLNEVDLFEDIEELGLRDLDCRPANPKRQEIRFKVHRCEKCGYASKDISAPIDFDIKILQSQEYLDILHSSYSYLTKTYMLASMIKESINNYEEAAELLLNACWILDDKGADAIELRLKTIELYKKCKETDKVKRIIVDLYRRAEEFFDAEEYLNEVKNTVLDKVDRQVLDFEEKLIEEYDSDCHSLSEIEVSEAIDYLGIQEDSLSELERKLYDENSNESLYITYEGKVTKFDQVALIQLNNRLFTILGSEVLGEDGALVYELVGDAKLESLEYVVDGDIVDKVIEEYYKLLKEN